MRPSGSSNSSASVEFLTTRFAVKRDWAKVACGIKVGMKPGPTAVLTVPRDGTRLRISGKR